MADIAQIGFKADTSDLDTAKQKLEALPGAAQKAERASDKLSSTFDKSAEAAGKAATASAKLQEQINKTAAATEKAATTNLRSLKDEAAARLAAERAAGKEYSSGITSRAGLAPGARKNNGGIVPNFEQNSAQINAGLDKIIGKQEKATAANDNFEKGLEKTNATASKSGGVFSSLGATLTRLATGFIAVFSITKMIDWLSNANEATIKLGDTAKRTGIELERLQQLQAAGVQKGLSRDQ